MSFCEVTYELLEPKPSGEKLIFVAPTTGKEYESKPEDTLLYELNKGGDSYELSKYKNEIKSAAYNPINPSRLLADGCPNCGNKVVSFIAVESKVINVCLCGKVWM